MIYHGTERNLDYAFQIEGWRGEEEGDFIFRRTGRPSDDFAKYMLLASSTRNSEEWKEVAANPI